MKWITREYVHVDRTACLSLTRNSLDPKAEFIFVPIERREEVVKTVGATPYDALRGYCRFKLLRGKHKSELEKMDRTQQSDFLRRKMQEQNP